MHLNLEQKKIYNIIDIHKTNCLNLKDIFYEVKCYTFSVLNYSATFSRVGPCARVLFHSRNYQICTLQQDLVILFLYNPKNTYVIEICWIWYRINWLPDYKLWCVLECLLIVSQIGFITSTHGVFVKEISRFDSL